MGVKVGQQLGALRKKHGISDAEAAEALSIRLVKYRTLEEDITQPDLDLIIKIADYFRISVDDLLNRPGSSTALAEPDLKSILESRPLYNGHRLSTRDVRILKETASKLARQSKSLQEIARLIEEEPELVRKLQELKILGSKLDDRTILHTIESALA